MSASQAPLIRRKYAFVGCTSLDEIYANHLLEDIVSLMYDCHESICLSVTMSASQALLTLFSRVLYGMLAYIKCYHSQFDEERMKLFGGSHLHTLLSKIM